MRLNFLLAALVFKLGLRLFIDLRGQDGSPFLARLSLIQNTRTTLVGKEDCVLA